MREDAAAEAWAFARETGDEAHDLLCRLARIPAPSHDEWRRARFVLDWLHGAGATAAFVDEAGNVVCPVSAGCESADDGGKLLVISAHTDVVFPDMSELPLDESDGRIMCPGVGDDTAHVVALMLCARHLLRNPRRLRWGVLFVANACEEGLGNLDGTKALFARYGSRIRSFVSLDCYLPQVVTGAVGSHRWRVTTRTEGGHSWSAAGKASAIRQMAGLVCDLYGIDLPTSARTTLNVGTIQGGSTVNSIAQEAQILFEYRSCGEECLDQVRRDFQVVLARHRAMGEDATAELLGVRPGGGAVDARVQGELVESCDRVLREVLGKEPVHVDASTDANVPLSLGIPAATVGLVTGGGAHTREEWVDAKSLEGACAGALALVLALS